MKKSARFFSVSFILPIVCVILLFSGSFFLNWYFYVPTASVVEERFKQKFPDYEFIEALTGDGHSQWVVYYVTYKKPDDQRIYEAIWEYHWQDEKWITYGGEGKPKE